MLFSDIAMNLMIVANMVSIGLLFSDQPEPVEG
jgi:hypothetical protein